MNQITNFEIVLNKSEDAKRAIDDAGKIGLLLRQIVIDKDLAIQVRKGSPTKHILVEAWQILGEMIGVHPIVVGVHPIDNGYSARVELYDTHNNVIGAGESICTHNEKMWASRDDFAVHAMAQTRATGRAFRNRFGQIAKLAGYSATPAEEMMGQSEIKEDKVKAEPEQKTTENTGLSAAQRKKLGALYNKTLPFGEASQLVALKNAGIECDDAISGFRKVTKENFDAVVSYLSEPEKKQPEEPALTNDEVVEKFKEALGEKGETS